MWLTRIGRNWRLRSSRRKKKQVFTNPCKGRPTEIATKKKNASRNSGGWTPVWGGGGHISRGAAGWESQENRGAALVEKGGKWF